MLQVRCKAGEVVHHVAASSIDDSITEEGFTVTMATLACLTAYGIKVWLDGNRLVSWALQAWASHSPSWRWCITARVVGD